jgi:hypothetical protein
MSKFTFKDKDRFINTMVYLIKSEIKRSVDKFSDGWFKWLAFRPHRVPNIMGLRLNGFVPDIKVTKYSSVFFKTEIDKIRESSLINDEECLKEVISDKITFTNIMEKLDSLKEISDRSRNTLEREIIDTRKRRLGWLSAHPQKVKTKSPPLAYACQSWSSPAVRDIFSPFRVICLSENIAEASSVVISYLFYVENPGVFEFRHPEDTHPLLIAAGRELVDLLNMK